MNRQQEYNDLLLELENTPEGMTQISHKTKTRAKKRKIMRLATMPPCIFVAVLLMITVAVNVSPMVSHAFERVPVLRQIAIAVNFSPSLTDAIEHEFIQHIDLAQTIGDINMRVEYVIVDQRQLNIFYILDSPIYSYLNSWRPSVRCAVEGTHLPVVISGGSFTQETAAVRQVVVNFFGDQMPSNMIFEMEVVPFETTQIPVPTYSPEEWTVNEWTKPENRTTFTFTLEFDPNFTEQGEIIYVNRDFVLDGQRLTITTVEIYPTHMRANFTADPSNTAWLRALQFHAENEHGHRFDTITSGITAFGSTDSPMIPSHVLHSPFFAESNELTIFISEVEWLDKDMQRVRIDLTNGVADSLPQGVLLDEARRDRQSWRMSFAVEERAENHSHSVFNTSYFNEYGDEFHFTSWSSGTRFYDSPERQFFLQFTLENFPYDVVYLSPSYSRIVRLYQPVLLSVR